MQRRAIATLAGGGCRTDDTAVTSILGPGTLAVMEERPKKRRRRRLERNEIIRNEEQEIEKDLCQQMVVWQPPPADTDEDCFIIPDWMYSQGTGELPQAPVSAASAAHCMLTMLEGEEARLPQVPQVEGDDDCYIIPEWMFSPGNAKQKLLQFQTAVWGPIHILCTQEEEERARKKLGVHRRPDIKAWEKVMHEGLYHFDKPQIGELPGLLVGFTCYSRGEMAAIGLHRKLIDGIDFIPENADFLSHMPAKSYEIKLPVATSIVMSGGYEDDHDDGETIVYSGRGGRGNLGGDNRQAKSQTFNEANCAMLNSMAQNLPIRVMRGHEAKVYSYSGLYQIVGFVSEPGQSGHIVFKFSLVRLSGQHPLSTEKVQYRGSKPLPRNRVAAQSVPR